MGIFSTVTALATLIGSLLAVLLPAPKSRVRVVCGCLLVSMGTENFLLAFGRNLPTWCVGAALGWLLIPVMSANLDALMRLNIPDGMQGRVYAVRNALQFFTIPVGYVLGGALVALVGELAAGPLLGMLQVPEDVFPLALLYLRIYLAGMPVILLYNFEAAIFRSVGETKIPLVALAVSGVLNVALNLFFVAVLGMTVNGVAIATVISNAVSAALLYVRLRRTAREVRLDPKRLRIDGAILGRILRIGLPAGLQSAVFAFSNIVIQAAINSLGTVVMAASSAAYNIEIITYDILNSFSQACTTFVGQNSGAGQVGRCRRTLALCLMEGALALAGAIAVILLFGKPLLTLFNSDPEVVETGYIRLMMVMISHSFSLLYEIMAGYLRGFGISLAPALLTMVGVCGVRIGWIQWVFPRSRTFSTIMTAYPISLSVTALLIFAALLWCHPAKRSEEKREKA